MKSHSFTLIGLWAFSLLANAGEVHIDISSDGDVALDVNTEEQIIADRPRRQRAARPVYKPRNKPQVFDDDYIVDIWPGKHRGFLERKV
jgi:hypothetical protein